MISHVCVGIMDFSGAMDFYVPLMASLGHVLKFSEPEKFWAGWKPKEADRPLFLIGAPYNGQAPAPGNGQMIALLAPDRKTVVACHAAAIANGGASEGAPGHSSKPMARKRRAASDGALPRSERRAAVQASRPTLPGVMDGILIRRIEPGDLPALTDIYNHYVRETPITFDIEPKTLEQRQGWLAGFAPTGRYQCFVAVRDGAPIGWASSHRYQERAAYDTTIVSSVYLAPFATGQGLGGKLYATLFEALEKEDIHRVLAAITVPNDMSVQLHRAFGFEPVGVYREVGRKFGRFWDVAAYLKPLKEAR